MPDIKPKMAGVQFKSDLITNVTKFEWRFDTFL